MTDSAFSWGSTSANTRSTPTWSAMASAVRALSPVIITTSRPISRIFAMASALDGLGTSATAMIPADRPSTATNIGVFPRVASASEAAGERSERDAALAHELAVAQEHLLAADARLDAAAGERLEILQRQHRHARRSVGALHDRLAQGMLRALLRRGGQLEQRVLARTPSASTMSVTTGAPSVIVPVLSSTTVWMRWVSSSAAPPLMRMPFSAPLPVPTMMAVGVARPSAQGQAMTSTAVKMVMLNTTLWPLRSQAAPASEGDQHDDRHEVSRDHVGELRDRGLRALRLLDELDDLGQGGVGCPRGWHGR